jgi:hypothetical protein
MLLLTFSSSLCLLDSMLLLLLLLRYCKASVALQQQRRSCLHDLTLRMCTEVGMQPQA